MTDAIKFPVPTGKYKIGFFDDVVSYDKNGENRKLGYRCYYPASEVSGEPVNYINEEIFKMFENFATNSPLVNWYREYINLKTNSYENAKASDGKFKVIVYSPGYNNVVWDNLVTIEELASQGYVVIALGRTGESFFTILGDKMIGKDLAIVNKFNEEIVKYFLEAEEYNKESPDPDFAYNWSLEGMQKYIRQCVYAGERGDIWAEDIMQTVTVLESISKDKNHVLYNKIDINSYGAFGNSFGGTASVNAAYFDERIGGAINFDGWLFGGKLLDNKLPKPALIFGKSQKHFEANYGAHNSAMKSLVFSRAQNEYMCDFCITNEKEIEAAYSPKEIISGKLMASIKTDFVLTFFNIYAKNDTSVSLEDIAKKYENEVILN